MKAVRLYSRPNRWKGFVLGVLGATAGVAAMDAYWARVAPRLTEAVGQGSESDAQASGPLDDIALLGRQYRDGESSTAALGRIFYTRITGQEPQSAEAKTILSYLVHYVYGMLQGGVYGAARSDAGGLDLLGGAAFAVGLWLFGDELAVPLLGLQSGPTAATPVQHANRLGAHLTYGLTTAAVTRLLQRLF